MALFMNITIDFWKVSRLSNISNALLISSYSKVALSSPILLLTATVEAS